MYERLAFYLNVVGKKFTIFSTSATYKPLLKCLIDLLTNKTHFIYKFME